VVLFRETNPANSRQTPATALLSRRSEAKTDDVQQKTDLSRRNEMKEDIAQDPALRVCWRIWTRSRHGVFTPWPASQNRLIWQDENKSNTPDAPAAVIKCDPCGFSRWLRHTQ
jgi:hypothetical protein